MLLNDYAESMAPIIKKWQIFNLVFIHIFYNIVYKVFCQGWSCKLSSIHLIPLKPFNWWRLSSKEKICILYVYIDGINSLKYQLKEIHILILIFSKLLGVFKLDSFLNVQSLSLFFEHLTSSFILNCGIIKASITANKRKICIFDHSVRMKGKAFECNHPHFETTYIKFFLLKWD